MLPFTREQFFDVFGAYNRAVFPIQIGLLLIALLCVGVAIWPRRSSDRWISGGLALLWLWIGAVYHLLFFTKINGAAYLFGPLFILEALLFAWLAGRKEPPRFRVRRDLRGVLGGFFVLYALAIYPLVGALAGHHYPNSPTFGLPCPTTIFTFGILLWSQTRVPARLLVVPALWSLVGGSGGFMLGVPEDTMLPIAGLLGTVLLLGTRRSPAPVTSNPAVPT